MRAITKSVTEVDSAQPTEPTMKTAIAIENTMRAPKRSAVQPLAGMKTASDNRYEVIASFNVSGLVPISAAIAGSEVAITVESMFSMNRAVATMSGIRRCLFMESRGGRNTGVEEGAYHRTASEAIAERCATSKSCVTPFHFAGYRDMRYYVLFFYRFVRLNVRARDRIAARRCPLTADAFRCDARADRSQITVLGVPRVRKQRAR